jgi:translation initiation factor 4A
VLVLRKLEINTTLVFLGEEAEELFETNWELEVDSFDDMGLKEEILRGIYAFGFKEPSPIQQKGILPII